MADPRCIITAPLPVARGLGFGELATVVAGDALVRRAWAVGRGAELLVPTLTGDLASQYAFDRELAREGHDRTSVKPDELEARAAAFEEDRRVAASQLFSRLSVTADLGLATTVTPAVSRAARTAFVRLYEEGLVAESARVVATCPRCRTPVDAVDTERGEIEGEQLTLRLTTSSGSDVDVVVREPELLPGAVAVAVPEGSPLVGASVIVPIADREVPVVSGGGLRHDAGVVVAAHDGDDHALALVHGLRPVPVLDADGAVICEGPLHGLGRYAARAAATALLDAEGVLAHVEPATEEVWRCRGCGSVLVPQLGRHWFVHAAALEVAAADAVRDGRIAFTPADARDAFLAGAGARLDWCVSTRSPSGVELPAATCLECGKVTVEVDVPASCGKCMGALVAEPLALDARFVAALWPLVLAGWPGKRTSYPPEETVAVVSPADLAGWAMPAVALALRLSGATPFAGCVVHPWPAPAARPDGRPFLDDAEAEPRVLRLALVAGTDALDVAEAAVAALDRPFADDVDPAEAAEAAFAGVAALDECAPAQAAALLASALSAGVPAEAADRLRALALPILGD